AGLALMATIGPASPLSTLLVGVVVFGAGFGLTVTPRSAAAVEALGRGAYGMASAGVTVARMAGLAGGLAVLTGVGSDRVPVALRGRWPRRRGARGGGRGGPVGGGGVLPARGRWAPPGGAEPLPGLFGAGGAVRLTAVGPGAARRHRARRRGGEAPIPPADGR